MHDPMPDSDQSLLIEVSPGLGDTIECQSKRGLMVDNTLVLPDPFDDAVDQRHTGLGLHQRIFQRRGPGVEDQYRLGHGFWAWIAVMATV
jgi:hypothetical protein